MDKSLTNYNLLIIYPILVNNQYVLSKMKIKRYQFQRIPFVSIVDDFDCPVCPYVSAYLSSLAGQAFNTQLRKANELLFVLIYFQKTKIDLVTRIRSGELISSKEYLQFYTASASKKNSIESSSAVLTIIGDKALRNAISANNRQIARVSNETHEGRIRRLREYMEGLFNHFHDSYSVGSDLDDRFYRLIATIKLDEKSLGGNKSQYVCDPCDSVIPDNIFSKLLEIIRPSSNQNPFKGSKVRNFLIVSIFIQSGIRRGALAKLKVSDFYFQKNYDIISIYRSGVDKTDPRLEKPNQKTKPHLATISPELMGQVKYYVDYVRSQIPREEEHDFIFLSEKGSRGTLGHPISLKSINAIFDVLSKTIGFRIHPHLLRHKWNEIFDKAGTEKGIDPRLLEDIRKYAMGWSETTDMASTYNDKRLAEKAREISKAHQKRVDDQR